MNNANDWESVAGELASRSEFRPGDVVRYQTAGQQHQGLILHITNGAMGQLCVVENEQQGFPDVVPVRELFGE